MRHDSFVLQTRDNDPVFFPASFFTPIDDFGDPFVNPIQGEPSASTNLVHGDEPSPAPRVKRRKTETRKIVRVPVPKEASDSEFVVPSDDWSWRKYGQKPIKGSPYPRGYYKCSGSKNCTAQKQVERSQTDPNMIVVTYISEHNHPGPIQKVSNPSKKRPLPNPTLPPEEIINTTSTTIEASTTITATAAVTTATTIDATTVDFVDQERRADMEKVLTSSKIDGDDLDQVFGNISADPIISAIDQWDDTIFPCFKEFEGDPMGLFMSKELFDEEWSTDQGY